MLLFQVFFRLVGEGCSCILMRTENVSIDFLSLKALLLSVSWWESLQAHLLSKLKSENPSCFVYENIHMVCFQKCMATSVGLQKELLLSVINKIMHLEPEREKGRKEKKRGHWWSASPDQQLCVNPGMSNRLTRHCKIICWCDDFGRQSYFKYVTSVIRGREAASLS